VRGLRWARLAAFGAVRAAIVPADSETQFQIELRAVDESLPPDTDTALADAGYATLTTIVGIAEAWPPEQAAHAVAERPVPGAPFDAVHTVPDASDSRNLHSRERA
jgi:hypothetical protein